MAKPTDFVVDNASGAAVRTDLNNIFDAISINNGFGTVPTKSTNICGMQMRQQVKCLL